VNEPQDLDLILSSNPEALMVRTNWDLAFVPELDPAIESALASASLVSHVDSDATNQLQVRAVQRLNFLIKGIEQAVKTHVAPFVKSHKAGLELGKQKLSALLLEKARLADLADGHRQKMLEAARVLEAEKQRKMQEEEQRIRAEQLARDRERFRIEQMKQAEIDAANKLAAEAKTKAAREKAQAEAERLRVAEAERLRLADEEAERQRNANQLQLQAIASAPVPEVPKADGQHCRDTWDWKQVDCEALVKSYGNRFVTMTVRRQELKDFVNGPDCPRNADGSPKLIGIFFRDSKQTVRQTGQKAIDV